MRSSSDDTDWYVMNDYSGIDVAPGTPVTHRDSERPGAEISAGVVTSLDEIPDKLKRADRRWVLAIRWSYSEIAMPYDADELSEWEGILDFGAPRPTDLEERT